MAKTLYQNICITLSNGKEIVATVPAFIEEGEHIAVTAVRVTTPTELPEGCRFEKITMED